MNKTSQFCDLIFSKKKVVFLKYFSFKDEIDVKTGIIQNKKYLIEFFQV